MSDVQKINRKFLFALISFIVYILFVVLFLIFGGYIIPIVNLVLVLDVVLLIGSLFVVSAYKTKFDQLTNISYIIKIRANPGEPLPMNHTLTLDYYKGYLQSQDFVLYNHDKQHALYYRLTKDKIKKMLSRYMLEVVVVEFLKSDSFFLDIVDSEIGKIQQLFLSERKTIDRMLMTQIKEIDDLDDKTRDSIKEIVFFKTRIGIISTINIGLHRPSKTAILLYSDVYNPSLYYRHHVELIKKII